MKTKEPDVILRAAHGLPEEARKMFAEEFSTNDIWQHFKAVQEAGCTTWIPTFLI